MAASVQLDLTTLKAIVKAHTESNYVGGTSIILIECIDETESRLGVDGISVYQLNNSEEIESNLLLTNIEEFQ